jgi:phage baseplate assembly protein gpV
VSTSLYESIARIARHESGARPVAAIGRVVDQFPPSAASPDYSVSVELRDTGLVLPRVPLAVGAMGFGAIPASDDLVVVLFAEGDYHAPVVIGCLYQPDIAPPEHKDGEIVLRLPPGKSEPDIDLSIIGATPSITLKLPGDVTLEIVKEKVLIQVAEMKVDLHAAGGGAVEIAAGGSTITLKKDGDITIKAGGNLKLEANEIDISGSAKVKISGGQVEIN